MQRAEQYNHDCPSYLVSLKANEFKTVVYQCFVFSALVVYKFLRTTYVLDH